jgi:hypothetical protein
MSDHRFALGQTVRLAREDAFDPDRTATYRIMRLLPFNGKQLRYCLEHTELLFTRFARERELIGIVPSTWRIR